VIVRSEAVTLRSLPYGETSQIVTLYTRQMGTVAVIAKGSRQPKSRFGSALQPMSYVQTVFYFKPSRDLHTLSECSHVVPLNGITRSLEKIAVGLRLVELTRYLLPDPDPNPRAFNLLLQVLVRLDHAEARAANLLPYFQLKLAAILGFEPDFEREQVRRLTESGGTLVPDNGAIHPAESSLGGLRSSRAALRAFAICSRSDLDSVMNLHLEENQLEETERLVEAYLRHHIGDSYPHRAADIVARLLHPDSGRHRA
jgi:DNA repair protein RecO (recombination protein O)